MKPIKINGKTCCNVEEVRAVAAPALSAFVGAWLDSSCDYVIGHTSGSTGKPKEIKLLKADMVQSARLTNRFFNLGVGSRFFLCLSPDYIAGKMMIVRAMEAGGEIVEEKPSNNPLAAYAGEPFDLVAVVPSQAQALVGHPARFRFVKNLIVGGGAVSDRLRCDLARLDVEAYSTYGMTETCSHVALSRLSADVRPYRALPPVTFSVDDRGCLVVHTPQFSFPSLTTNDVVELLSEQEFRWIGRYDNVINTGGIKVFPEDIEKQIASKIHCRYYIAARPSEKWGSEVVLVLESKPLCESEKSSLLQTLKSVLPTFSVPKDIVCFPVFRETSSGKVIRKQIY